MASWLLTWNPEMRAWDDLHDEWRAVPVRRVTGQWAVDTPRMAMGDRVFLTRVGASPHGVVASGYLVGATGNPGGGWTVTVVYDVLLHPDEQPLFDPRPLSAAMDWTPSRSAVAIREGLVAQLEDAWRRHLWHLGLPASDALGDEDAFAEGRRLDVTLSAYERDPAARAACIAAHGPACAVCGLDFGKRYGEPGKGYIHVHHLVPISYVGKTYAVDPVADLRPVCPNCHAMLHRKSPPLTIAALKKMMTDAE